MATMRNYIYIYNLPSLTPFSDHFLGSKQDTRHSPGAERWTEGLKLPHNLNFLGLSHPPRDPPGAEQADPTPSWVQLLLSHFC